MMNRPREQNEEQNRQSIYDCVVVGGGISGISFAHNVSQKGEKVLVLERESDIGGQIRTRISADDSFWSEMGAHTCYNSYTHLLSIVDDIHLASEILALDRCKYLIHANDKIKKPTSQIAFLPLMWNGSRIFFSSRGGKTVKEYFAPIVGKRNYNKLFSNMFRAVISQNADDYPAEMFLKRRSGRRADVVRKFSFSKGLSSFLHAIVEKNALEVRTDTEAKNIVFRNSLYTITTTKGDTYTARNLAMAVDPPTAAQLLQDLEPEVANVLRSISMFRSEVMNVIVEKGCLSLQKVAGIIPVSNDFMSVVSRDVSEHPRYRAFSFHFAKNTKSESEKMNIVCRVLDIVPTDILESTTNVNSLPSLRKQHIDIISDVEKSRRNKSLFLLGNYYYGLSLEDCIHRSFDESERLVRETPTPL